MTQRRLPRAVVSLTLAAAMATSVAPSRDAAAADLPADRRAAPGQLTITEQDFSLAADDTLDITVALPTATTPRRSAPWLQRDDRGPPARGAASLGAVRAVLDGEATSVEDSVEIELDIDVADPRVLRPSATELSLAIATESSTSTPDALRLPDWASTRSRSSW
jgi:hypothetical protein